MTGLGALLLEVIAEAVRLARDYEAGRLSDTEVRARLAAIAHDAHATALEIASGTDRNAAVEGFSEALDRRFGRKP